MLLLSSATRILATERPPDNPHQPLTEFQTVLEHSSERASISTERSVSEVDMVRFLSATCPKGQGVRPKSHPLNYLEQFSAAAGGAALRYQGMSLLSPFFLLLDSFWFCESAAGGVPSVFAESVAAALVDGAVPSVFAGSLAAASVAGGLPVVPSLVVVAAASGVVAAGGSVADMVPVVESLAGAVFTSSVVVPAGGVPLGAASPGTTVATIPLFPAPGPFMLLPPVKMSV